MSQGQLRFLKDGQRYSASLVRENAKSCGKGRGHKMGSVGGKLGLLIESIY